jgi:hypothetical protein
MRYLRVLFLEMQLWTAVAVPRFIQNGYKKALKPVCVTPCGSQFTAHATADGCKRPVLSPKLTARTIIYTSQKWYLINEVNILMMDVETPENLREVGIKTKSRKCVRVNLVWLGSHDVTQNIDAVIVSKTCI